VLLLRLLPPLQHLSIPTIRKSDVVDQISFDGLLRPPQELPGHRRVVARIEQGQQRRGQEGMLSFVEHKGRERAPLRLRKGHMDILGYAVGCPGDIA